MDRVARYPNIPCLLWIFPLVLLLAGCATLALPADPLTGTWQMASSAEVGEGPQFTFGSNAEVTLSADGQTFAGTYQLDSSVEPFALDIELEEIGPLAAIVAFDDPDTIRIAAEAGGVERPSAFDAENTEVFVRVGTVKDESSAQQPSNASMAPITLSGRAAALESLLRYVPDSAEYRDYLTFGDYDAWLRSWALERPDNIDDLLQMSEPESRLWKFRMIAQTTPAAAFHIAYLMAEDMRETHGFSFFDALSYLEAGAPPQMLSVVMQNRNRSDIEEALTTFGYESATLNEETVLYSIGEDFEVNLEAESVIGRLGNLNRIAIQDDRLIIAGGASIVEDAVAGAGDELASLADAPDYRRLLQSLDAPELTDVGELVGVILFDADSSAASYADSPPSEGAPAQVVAQGERISQAQPSMPTYSLAGLATYRAADATYLGLHVLFPTVEDAEAARDALAERLPGYVSSWTGTPLPWTLEDAFVLDETAVVVMRLDETLEEPSTVSWYDMIISGDTTFLRSE